MKKARILALLLAAIMLASLAFAESEEDPVIIQVGEVAIRLSEVQPYFDDIYAQYNDYYISNGYALSADDIEFIREQALEDLALNAILQLKIAEFGLDELTEEEKASYIEEMTAEFEAALAAYAEYYGLSIEEAEEDVAAQGITLESQIEAMLEDLPYTRLAAKIIEGVTVSDEQVQKEYDSEVDLDKGTYSDDVMSYELYTSYYGYEAYYVPEGYRFIKHILLAIPDDIQSEINAKQVEMEALDTEISLLTETVYAMENVDQEAESESSESRDVEDIQADIDEKKIALETLYAEYEAIMETIVPALQGTIDEILTMLNEGKSFDDLILAYGTDPGMTSNPEGYMVHKDSIIWDTDFRDAAAALKAIGDVSDPVLTGFGVHLIQYANDVPGGAVPITSEIKESIRSSLLQTAQEAAISEILDQWMSEYTIEKNPGPIVMPEAVSLEEDVPANASESTPG